MLRIKEYKCKLLTNKNQFEQTLFAIKPDTVGTLIEVFNTLNKSTTWEITFAVDKWVIHDRAVLDRYIGILK
jgi:hypothetical protein